MQRIKRMVKKITAISAGAIMLGATITGALAADLSTYPTPFVDVAGQKYDYLMIYGTAAKGSDVEAATYVAQGLDKVEVSSGAGGTVTVVGGQSEDVPMGKNIAGTNELENLMSQSDLSWFQDGDITFQSASYDTSEKLVLGLVNNISMQDSMSIGDDDYLTNVYMHADRDSIRYYYKFDETIKLNSTTASDALKIKFLGKTLKITAIGSDTKFTAYVGEEHFMNVGESVTVEGKTITLKKVGSTDSIVIDVDGVEETISSGGTETVNGIEIVNDEAFYTDTASECSATLVIGTDASETYKDNDAYVGEDADNPDWKWHLANLNTESSTTIINNQSGTTEEGPIIAVDNYFQIVNEDDNPPTVGECISLPNDYVQICFDSLTVKDEDYLKITCEVLTNGVDIEEAGFASTYNNEQAVKCTTGSDEDAIVIDASDLTSAPANISSDQKTDSVYFWVKRDEEAYTGEQINLPVGVFYEDSNNKLQYAGQINYTSDTGGAGGVGFIDYKNIGTDDIQIDLTFGNTSTATATDGFNITFNPYDTNDRPVGTDNITLWFGVSANKTNSLGASTGGSDAEGDEVSAVWKGTFTAIGTKDEDHRNSYGMIIRDPKSHSSSDEAVIEIPGDMLRANVVIKGASSAVGTSGTGGTLISQVATAPDLAIASAVSSVTGKNLILIGGSCVNEYTAQFLGLTYPACGTTSGLAENEAIVKLADNGGKVAMIVAGWEADDTIRAGKVLRNYALYKTDLKGTEVKVAGTGKTVTSVKSA